MAHDYSQDFLTLEALSSGRIALCKHLIERIPAGPYYYRVNGGPWVNGGNVVNDTIISVNVNAGDKVEWLYSGSSSAGGVSFGGKYGLTATTCQFNAYGNSTSMAFGADFLNPDKKMYNRNDRLWYLFSGAITLIDASNVVLPQKYLTESCFRAMFRNCTSLIAAPDVIAETISDNCCREMFYWCKSLPAAPTINVQTVGNSGMTSMFAECYSFTEAPYLPATTLGNNCYYNMFGGCSGITSSPTLPATALSQYCYESMFNDCTSLVNPPTLPATTLAPYCYYYMFERCTSLVNPPTLPATTLAQGCYCSMFVRCTSLVNAPALPATALSKYCYYYMFERCTSLVNAPTLPATTLAQGCYCSMFVRCTSLTAAPVLPATTLAPYCYCYMFGHCTSLVNAPELPATALSKYCYYDMFYDCTSLTTAPVLPATTLEEGCYYGMFQNCSSLNYIKCLATFVSYYSLSWVLGVASAGTFVKAEEMEDWEIGVNGIPVGWIVKNAVPEEIDYLKFKVANGTGGEIKWVSCSSALSTTISYSKDSGNTWTPITSSSGDTAPSISVNPGDTVLFKGNNLSYSLDNLYYKDHCYFNTNFYYTIEGNILSLVYGDNFSGRTDLPQESGFTFCGLFVDNTGLTSASGLSLPATTLSKACYAYMFQGCSNLTSLPELPATTLADSCYYGMFSYCTSIVSPPVLPATELADFCYSYMFGGCSALTTAPELPVMTLADSCYDSMFWKCVSLTTAPDLPATELVHRCYFYMFAYCTSLNYIKCLATTGIDTDYNTVSWLNTVSPTGTFIKNSASTWSAGDNGIPDDWIVQVA